MSTLNLDELLNASQAKPEATEQEKLERAARAKHLAAQRQRARYLANQALAKAYPEDWDQLYRQAKRKLSLEDNN